MADVRRETPGADPALPRERLVAWERTYRIVPSRYPPVDLFERIGDPAEWELLAQIEGMTNDRLRDEIGDISLVPPADRIAGPGASPIMAAFTHVGFPSRFGDGRYGVYYASDRFEGALAEVAYHRGRFLARTREPETRLEMRLYVGEIRAKLHDVRRGWPEVHAPESYTASQQLGGALRARGSHGIAYRSVRLAAAANIAVFRPRVLAASRGRPHVREGGHLYLLWDGERITKYIRMGDATWVSL